MSGRITPNHREIIAAQSSITGQEEYLKSTNGALNVNGSFSIAGTSIPISGATTAVGVAIVDGSGNQITSFGGGTQYTDGSSTVTHPIGTIPVFNNAGTITAVSVANPLPVAATFSGTIGTVAQGTAAALSAGWPVELSDGTNLLGVSAHPVRTDPTGTTTQPVSGSVSVSNFPASQAVTGTFWQTTQPVSLATNTPTLQSGSTTAVTQTTPANLNATIVGTGTLAVQVTAAPTTAVTGTFFQATQPVSATSLPLPTGASTSSLQTTGNTSLSSIDTKLSGTLSVTGSTVGSSSGAVNVGQKAVNTSAVQISVTSTVPTNGILIGALSTNAASIFIGGSGVTTSTGAELLPGASLPFTANLNTLYIISVASTTDKIWYNVA